MAYVITMADRLKIFTKARGEKTDSAKESSTK